MSANLTNSQITTIRSINSRPGRLCVVNLGLDYAIALEKTGYIEIKNGKCYPTAAAAAYLGRP